MNILNAKSWYKNVKLHKEDGPAVEHADGAKFWYKNGMLHREDGSAIELANGLQHWHLNGKCYGVNNDFANESWIRFFKTLIFY